MARSGGAGETERGYRTEMARDGGETGKKRRMEQDFKIDTTMKIVSHWGHNALGRKNDGETGKRNSRTLSNERSITYLTFARQSSYSGDREGVHQIDESLRTNFIGSKESRGLTWASTRLIFC